MLSPFASLFPGSITEIQALLFVPCMVLEISQTLTLEGNQHISFFKKICDLFKISFFRKYLRLTPPKVQSWAIVKIEDYYL